MFWGLKPIYTIIIDKMPFDIAEVYIGISDIYVIIAYILPSVLANTILIQLDFIFNIIAVAYNIIAFIIKFSKNITSIYIVMVNHLLFLPYII